MTWDEIREIDRSEFGHIGHHSHSHDYLIDKSNSEFIEDIETASGIFKSKLGYVPTIFSYPFGEYSKFMIIFQKISILLLVNILVLLI